MTVVDVVVAVFMLTAGVLAILAGLGLLQFESVFARMHAATKAITLGLVLVVLAASIQLGTTVDVSKLVLAAFFQFITAPIASHMVGRSAYGAGTETSPRMQVDELAPRHAELRAEEESVEGS